MQKPVRVAQIIGKLMAGGVESVVYNYYRNIDHSQIQFDFYYDSDSTVDPPEELIDMGARFYKIPPYQKFPSFIKALQHHFKNNQYTIVHAHLNTLNIFPLYAAWIAGVPARISHNHSTAGKGERKNILKYLLRPFAKIFPTHYYSCSIYAAKWLFGERFYNNGKVMILKNAIDLKKFAFSQEIREQMRAKLGLQDSFVVGHVGRFCYAKNHDYLIEIFKEVYVLDPKAKLLLIGDGELKEKIERKVKHLGLVDVVCFMGIRENVQELLQAMDVFVLPSRYEGLPVVAVEAQAAGLPCILSDAMTKETKILESTVFLSAKQCPKVWANTITKHQKFIKNNALYKIKNAGFCIQSESTILAGLYGGIVNGEPTYKYNNTSL